MLQVWPLLCHLSLPLPTLAQLQPAAAPEPPVAEPPADGAGEPAAADGPEVDTNSPSEPLADAAEDTSASSGAPTAAPAMVVVRAGAATGAEVGAEVAAGPNASAFAGPGSSGAALLTSRAGQAVGNPSAWSADFHGYFNAPMRVGVGHRDEPAEGQGSRTYHSPLVPDDMYLSWQHTKHNPREWAELFLSYGNELARGVVSIEGYNFTDANWNETNAQFGITKAYLLITPRLTRTPLRVSWRIGAADNRYGQTNVDDGGEYETFLFGRTSGLGETTKIEIPVKALTITLEHGVAAKRPDPETYTMSRFTLLNHAHLGVKYRQLVDVNFHYLTAWAAEEDRDFESPLASEANPPDGRMTVLGPDFRFNGGKFGSLYAGASWIKLNHARTVGSSIEVIHASGGGNFTLGLVHNYLEGPVPGYDNNESNGNGEILTVLVQADHSVQRLLQGDDFWGQSRDLGLRVYTMWNKVKSDAAAMNGVKKFKYGAQVYFSALKWLGGSIRYDRVQPNSNIAEQSFSVLSPRLLFRTDWITHEEVGVQYSRYLYNVRECDEDAEGVDLAMCLQPPAAANLPEGLGAPGDSEAGIRSAPLAPPDVNTFSLQAKIWW
ncbi:MAG: hypothetical protein V3V08_13260 [Nannocystaceae bacterium]